MPPTDCINRGMRHAPFILTLTSRKTTSTALNHSLHQHSTWTTQLPASSVCYQGQHDPLHQHVETARLSLPLILEITFLLFPISDGGTEFQQDSSDAGGPRLHPTGDPQESGWTQLQQCLLLSHKMNPLCAAHLS